MQTERPAGWYQDPDDPSILRYWYGDEWSQSKTRPIGSWQPVAEARQPATRTDKSEGRKDGAAAVIFFLMLAGTLALVSGGAPVIVIAMPAFVAGIALMWIWARSRYWPSELLDRLEGRDRGAQ